MADLHDEDRLVSASSRVVSAYVSHNPVAAVGLMTLIDNVYQTLKRLANPAEPETALAPAAPVRSSIRHDRLVCLECGLPFKSLKRHLRVQHGLDADAYRTKWGLPRNYPIVAPDYAKRRSELAKSLGLGRNSVAKPARGKTRQK